MRLLIFKVNQLGDNVVFLPVVQWLAKVLPKAEITVFTSPVAAPLYEKGTPGVKVETFATKDFNGAWKKPAKLFRLRQCVRQIKPDACFVAQDQGNVAHLLAWMSGAKHRIGTHLPHCRLGPLLTHRTERQITEPVAFQNWQIAAAMLDSLGVARDTMPTYPPVPDLSCFRNPSATTEPFILIHPGAARAYSRWPAERYVELANRLSEEMRVRYVLQNEAAESALLDRVTAIKPDSLEEFISIVSQASFFIGNNSGPMHIVSCFGIPSVVFNGPASPNWKPMWHLDQFTIVQDKTLACQPCDTINGPINHCTNPDEPMACMKRWSVEAVIQMVQGLRFKVE